MADTIYQEDLLWLVGSDPTPKTRIDSAQAAVTVPRRVPASRGCSFQLFDPTNRPSGSNGGITGTLTIQASNAPMRQDKLVGDAFWVPLDELSITLGGQSGDALPTLQQLFFSSASWVQMTWKPSSSQGTLAGRFDGPRP